MSIIEPSGKNFELHTGGVSKTVIGDENSRAFMPCARYSAFGEDDSGLIFRTPTSRSINPVVADGVIGWDDPANNIGARFYEHAKPGRFERGAIEHEVILYAKPASNEIPFHIELNKIKLLQQPVTLPPGFLAGSIRPADMAGGFTAYHSHKGGLNHAAWADRYKAGKAFDLPLPTAKDTTGAWIYGSWALAGNVLRATFDPNWLASASYPVVIGPTVGYTTIGANQNPTNAPDFLSGNRVVTASAGTLSSMSIYMKRDAVNGNVTLAIYDSPDPQETISGDPRRDYGAQITTIPVSPDWLTSSGFSATVAASTRYWLAHNKSVSAGIYYDAGFLGEADDDFFSASAYAHPAPATAPAESGASGVTYSLYATYGDPTNNTRRSQFFTFFENYK